MASYRTLHLHPSKTYVRRSVVARSHRSARGVRIKWREHQVAMAPVDETIAARSSPVFGLLVAVPIACILWAMIVAIGTALF